MNIHCNIIRDLLPSYLDEVCSEETKQLVEHHLQDCESCRAEYESMADDTLAEPPTAIDEKLAKAAISAWRKSRRQAFIKGTAIALVAVLLLFVIFVFPHTKQCITLTVRVWTQHLTVYAQRQLSLSARSAHSFCGYKFDAWPADGYVLVEKLGNTQHKGFYYSATGGPIGYQGADMVFQQQGDGWLWIEVDGDNWMYTERIVDNWYWYEMHF